MKPIKTLFANFILWVKKHKKISAVGLIIIIVLVIILSRTLSNKPKVQYQTASVEKNTLVVSVAASGQVSTNNSASVTTQTSGVVSQIYVQNGQTVKSGDPIAQVDLDMDGKQRAAQALASYQSAKNSLESAKYTLYSVQSDMLGKWDTFKELAESDTYKDTTSGNRNLPEFYIPQDDWLAAEAKYKNQQNVIAQAQTSVNSAWAAYQQSSPTIYAPISGVISGLSLQVGSVLTAQTSSTGSSTSQRIANIKTQAAPAVTVNLTQIDVPNVQPGNLATITLDAFPGKTYTGKVVSIDTTGIVSSGVTSYPAVIKLDLGADEIFPNMTGQANIITQTKNDILLIPSAAVHSQNGQTYVQIMKNNQVSQVAVVTGLSSSTQTEITSGLSEGDTVVISTTNSTTSRTQTTTSPFSLGGNRGFGGR
ncbi:MAG: HlyD family efflux transporter periplasmic adaptor subunit [Candidatus Beckwithbacteria bacterium]|nr:HlyD family efflux transporter periplasmic adaptor subunit [Candidatus Beckwithbacteria bacterium]